MPFSKLFRSRWAALLWAGGILWTAADVAGAFDDTPDAGTVAQGNTDATGEVVSATDLALFANAMNTQ